MKIYHQAGHNTNWNIDSLEEHKIGDGIIFSPVHYSERNLNNINPSIKEVSLFDPQFYVPNSQKSKLNQYDFFPEKAMNGFASEDFVAYAVDVANKCIDFQLENNFEAIIIPTRYYNELLTDYIIKQKIFSVEPFLKVFEKKRVSKEIFLSLPLTITMIVDKEYRAQILDWISSYSEISGVYLIVNFAEETKQIKDYNKLFEYVSFIKELKNADLKVIAGYQNIEGLLITPLEINGYTIGTFENTRKFTIDKFLELDNDRRGPAVRIYFPKLLNSIRFITANEIRNDHPEIWNEIYEETEFSQQIFNNYQLLKDTSRTPHFTQSESYKHYLQLIYRQYKKLIDMNNKERLVYLRDLVRNANSLYQRIYSTNILFVDDNCRGEHLAPWNRLINNLTDLL